MLQVEGLQAASTGALAGLLAQMTTTPVRLVNFECPYLFPFPSPFSVS